MAFPWQSRFLMVRMSITLAAVLGAALALAAGAEPEKPGGALSILRQLDEGFVQVFEKVAPAVVVIEAEKKIEEEERDEIKGFEFFFNGEKDARKEGFERSWRLPSRSEGSGFVIRPEGFILTNHHVVTGAEKLTVRLKDGRAFEAKVVGMDAATDIAVLRIEAKDLPCVEFGDSDRLRVGQLVCAIGTPYNQAFSFTVGWVSGKGRSKLLGPSSSTVLFEDYIQTDAFINPGNSGGPLFDVEGRVVGMNTLINGIGRGLAFAIPAAMLQEVGGKLIAEGRVQRAWLGIRMEPLEENATLRERITDLERGLVVDTIEANAPAYKSDLRPADVIVEVDGVKVAAARDLQREMWRKKVGDIVQLTVWRGGTTLKIPVTTGALPAELARVPDLRMGRPNVAAKAESLGLKLRDAQPAGAVVAEVAPDSPASRADVQADDVITEVEGRAVPDAAACAAAIGDRVRDKQSRGVLLNIDRRGKRTYAVLVPER